MAHRPGRTGRGAAALGSFAARMGHSTYGSHGMGWMLNNMLIVAINHDKPHGKSYNGMDFNKQMVGRM